MIWNLLQYGQAIVRDKDLKAISDGSIPAGQLLISLLLGALMIGLAVWYVLWWKYKSRMVAAPIGEEQTFQRLCDVSDLSKSEAYLVRKVVFGLKIANPLEVFTDPTYFDVYAASVNGNRAARIKSVRNKLFV